MTRARRNEDMLINRNIREMCSAENACLRSLYEHRTDLSAIHRGDKVETGLTDRSLASGQALQSTCVIPLYRFNRMGRCVYRFVRACALARSAVQSWSRGRAVL